MKVGDRVCYARKFLLSTFGPTGEVWRLRGSVEDVGAAFGGSRLITVKWDGEPEPMKVLECNLAKPGTVAANG